MRLSREIAERIVLIVSAAIDHGVSITDADSRVLASTDQSLIGSHDAGAERAIATGELVEDTAGQVQGIGQPLSYNEQVIGAIVLKDSSQHGKETIQIATSLAELIVHQAGVIERLPHQRWVHDAFIADLLWEHLTASPDMILRQADVLNLNLRVPRVVMVVNIEPLSTNRPVHRGTKASLPQIARTLRIEQMHTRLLEQAHTFITTYETDIYSFVDEHSLLLLATVDPSNADDRRRQLAVQRQRFIDNLAREHGVLTTAGVGRFYPGWQGLPRSFSDARCARESGMGLNGTGHVFLIEDLGLASFICSEDQRLKQDLAHDLIQPLAKEPELLTTLEVFLRGSLSPSHVADALHIHRHTVAYRLDKITQLTRLDPRQFEAAAQLYAALVLWKVGGGHT